MVSLGKGQGKKAAGLLEESCEKGFWVFLSNCHLSVNLLPELESIMDDLYKKNAKKMHPNFRIFLSAVPTDDFPISLLQRALKLTQEPPRGIKMNMTRLYKNMDKEFIDCDQD
jgi:dynein heavy chain